MIDTANNTVTARISVGDGPNEVVSTPDGRHVYVVNSGPGTISALGTISVIDTISNTVANTLYVGSNPKEITIAPDGHHAYVTNYLSNNVSVIEISDR